jgi:hypothetical protein
MFLHFQAQPLLRDRKKFTQMADPLLEDKYPIKGLYQALAVAAMCLQEEADTRPLISDVVTALEFLANKKEEDGEQYTKETFASQGGNDNGNDETNVVHDDDDDDDDDDDNEEDEDSDDDDEDADSDNDNDDKGHSDNDNNDKGHRR